MAYDRSHKRRLVDSCGHERCYSCIGRNYQCSLCLQTGISPHKVSRAGKTSNTRDLSLSRSGLSRVLKQDRQGESNPVAIYQPTTLGTAIQDNIETNMQENRKNSILDNIQTNIMNNMQDKMQTNNQQTSMQLGTPSSTLDRKK